MDFHLLFSLLVATYFFKFTYGLQRDVKVEEQSSLITYSGSWREVSDGTGTQWDSGGSHMVTNISSSMALFTFTGVAVSFMSPLWPYNVNTVVSIDGGSSTVIDLVDHSGQTSSDGSPTVMSAVVWSSGPLSNTQHTLRISVGSSGFAVVDALIYTTDDSLSLSSSSSTNSASSSSSATASTNSASSSSAATASTNSPPSSMASSHSIGSVFSSTRTSVTPQGSTTTIVLSETSKAAQSSMSGKKLPIILGATIGVLALALIIVIIAFYLCRRRGNRSASNSRIGEGPSYTAPKEGGSSHIHPIADNSIRHPHDQPYAQDSSFGFANQSVQRPEAGYPTLPLPPPPMMMGVGITHVQGNFNHAGHSYQEILPFSSTSAPVYPPSRPFIASEATTSHSSERLPYLSGISQMNHGSQGGGMDASSSMSASHAESSYQRHYNDQKEHLRLVGDNESLQFVPTAASTSHGSSSYQQHYSNKKELIRLSGSQEKSTQFTGTFSDANVSANRGPPSSQEYYDDQREYHPKQDNSVMIAALGIQDQISGARSQLVAPPAYTES